MTAAMPWSKAAVNEFGTIYGRGAKFHTHINLRDGEGKHTNMYGPSRATENEA